MDLLDPAIIGRDSAGTVIGWNHGAERLLGYSAAEILGASVERLIPADQRERDAELLARLLCGERVPPGVAVRLHKDGSRLTVSVAPSPILGPTGAPVAVSEVVLETVPAGRPADEPEHYLKRELYEEMRTHPALFEFLQAGSLDGLWYWDLERPEAEWMSPRLKEVLGYQDHEVPNVAAWWQENIFPEDLELVVESFKRHCADPDQPHDLIVRYRHKNGSTVWVRCRGIVIRDGRGKPVRMLGAHTDVTAIKTAEERFRAVHDALPDMYLVADLGSGAILEHNQVLADSTGYSRRELADKTFFELCRPQSVPVAEGALTALGSRDAVRNVELTFRRKDGGALPVLVTARKTSVSAAAAALVWCRDISHLHRVANVEVLLEALPNGALVIDEQRLVVAANAVAERMFRSSRDDLLGRGIDLLLTDLEPEPSPTGSGQLSPSGAVRMLGAGRDLEALRTDGTRFPAQVGLSQIRAREGTLTLVTLVDVTERKRIEDALRESEQRFRELAESLPQLIWTTGADGFCDYFSRRWLDFSGLPPGGLLGLGWAELLHPDERAKVFADWQQATADGTPYQVQFRMRRSDGAYRWFDVRAVPLRDREGRIVKWIGASTDVHEEREVGEALRREKERLDTLAASVPGVLYSFRLSPGGRATFPYSSPAIVDLFGLEAEWLAEDGEAPFALVDPRDVERVRASIAASADSLSAWHEEFRLLHPDKGPIWLEARSLPQREPDGGVIWHGFVTDVTERRQAEQAIAENEARLAGIIGSAMDGILTVDEDQRILLLNPAAERMFGVAGDEMLGTPLGRLLPKRFRAAHAEHVRAFGRSGVTRRKMGELGEIFGLRADGTEFPIEASISQIEVAERRVFTVILRDVTERRRAEEELRTSQAQLLAALEAGGMGTWTWDVERDRFTWDDSLVRLWGLTRDEVAGRGLGFALERLHPEDREGVRAAFQEVLRQGADTAGEFRVVSPDGSLRYMGYRGRVERDAAGRPRRMTGVTIDITAPKLAAEQQLRSQKLEALGTLAGGIAHDFNNILLAITGNTKLASADLPPEHPVQGLLAEIAKAGSRAAELVRRILAFSRSEDQKLEVVPLRPVVEEALHLLRATLPTMIELHADFGAEAPQVAADSPQVHQVLINLVTNSAHAIAGRRGTIEIRLDEIEVGAEPDRALADLRPGRYARLSVRDDGCGMDRETLSRIFDPFFTTKPPGQGTGLGLSLVHSMVESHHGAITVESQPGRGTTFHLYFPAAVGAAAKAQPHPAEPRPSHGARILYVDDEEALVLLASRLLERLGYQVTGYTDPAGALEAFRAQPDGFDVVVTDLSMPGMSGFELAFEILGIRPDVPVVMTSGYFRTEDQQTAAEIGIAELILKPNTAEELGRSLGRLLGGRGSATEG